ncbi:MAG: hypothetical protein R2856_22920 [Caldilineaceae bacterium]
MIRFQISTLFTRLTAMRSPCTVNMTSRMSASWKISGVGGAGLGEIPCPHAAFSSLRRALPSTL